MFFIPGPGSNISFLTFCFWYFVVVIHLMMKLLKLGSQVGLHLSTILIPFLQIDNQNPFLYFSSWFPFWIYLLNMCLEVASCQFVVKPHMPYGFWYKRNMYDRSLPNCCDQFVLTGHVAETCLRVHHNMELTKLNSACVISLENSLMIVILAGFWNPETVIWNLIQVGFWNPCWQ